MDQQNNTPLERAEIRVGDRIIRLRFNRADLIEIKKEHGVSFIQARGLDNLDEDLIPQLLYRGAKHALNGTTYEEFVSQLEPAADDEIMALFEAATGREHPSRKNGQTAAATTT